MNTKLPLITEAQFSRISKLSHSARFIKDLVTERHFRSVTQRDCTDTFVGESSDNVRLEVNQTDSTSDRHGGLTTFLSQLLSIDTGIELRLLPGIGSNKTNSFMASRHLRE
jgi:hypothetical protein